MNSPIMIGNGRIHHNQPSVHGYTVPLMGERFYCIENYDQMPPFFMSIVSSSDHWIFISSTGGLTAGRKNSDSSLFPYETEDKVAESFRHTGPISIFFISKAGQTSVWEPFSERCAGLYPINRKLYKNIHGNKLLFEETNMALGLTYRQVWRTSDQFGFVLTSLLINYSETPAHVRLLAGVRNILPYGATAVLQSAFSNLLDAYKRSELEVGGLGIFSLSSTLTDLAEPSESLMSTSAFQVGLENPKHLLSSKQVTSFRKGEMVMPETDMRGLRCAYLLVDELALASGEERPWHIVLDVDRDSSDLAELINLLKKPAGEITQAIDGDVESGTKALNAIVASADGLQTTADGLSSAHHYANVLFNTMRGGIFVDNYWILRTDLLDFLGTRNREVVDRQAVFLGELPEKFTISQLMESAGQSGDPDLERLCFEYLPLTFSRRHGDPSRPWNRFSINIKHADGSPRLDYEGNWRDIFQNWEALACSYPGFVESMIAKFINAGTPDGYNPYRITREGVEWEIPEPDSPWANLGYWSDHQIIYLLKLMEISSRYHPRKLTELMNRRIFSYVNVPYRLRNYESLLKDPYKTIDFDQVTHLAIEEAVKVNGTDEKLVHTADGEVYHVTLNEKLLVFLLAKLVNFVPEGGIWMNTQRPEWNDANNALVGKGLSVVTLGYLRRYILFWHSQLEESVHTDFEISQEVNKWFIRVYEVLTQFGSSLDAAFSAVERRNMMDALGSAGSDYRRKIYQHGFRGDLGTMSVSQLKDFLDIARRHIEHSLQANRRTDGLYHAYNILKLDGRTAGIGYLEEMLEGQVAILSSGVLHPQEALILLRQLRESDLYRADQHSYILYPDRDLPPFVSKNLLPRGKTREIDLVKELVKNNDSSLIHKDINGDFHFNGSFRNARDVQKALEILAQEDAFSETVAKDGKKVLALFEEVFQHDSFTGRSGRFFAYEGLGSIYWHMVSKLLLAVHENLLWAVEKQAEPDVIQGLVDRYWDIRQGLGFNKSPEEYGAFPTDPYSHTPKGQGAKQPGMTGQVKEEILTRQAEMGLFVENGQIVFNPMLLRSEEVLNNPAAFQYVDLNGLIKQIDLPSESFAFTFCQTPFIYQVSDSTYIQVHFNGGEIKEISSNRLDRDSSQHIFRRDGMVTKVIILSKNL